MGEGGVVALSVVDAATGEQIPCRIHLADVEGTPIAPEGCPAWADHFVCAGRASVQLAPGTYRYRVERGPEWRTLEGAFTVQQGDRTVRLELDRVVDLPAEGWWAGDLHVHRAPAEGALLADAEGLLVAPPVAWWTIEDPLLAGVEPSADAGEDEREGGALLYFGLVTPAVLDEATWDRPPSSAVLAAAREHPGVHVAAEKPTWWDLPMWLARGIDSVGIATNHLWPVGGMEGEGRGRARDVAAWPAPHGTGLWTQELYYRILESGISVAPSAGSASGVMPSPVGYNRVYVHLDTGPTPAEWWAGLRAGRSFVTNGPLLRVRANGELPGHVFTAGEGATVGVEVRATLTSRDPIRVLEIVRNGVVAATLRPDGDLDDAFLGRLAFDEPGWFLVRAIADTDATFRFASTAPFHVDVAGRGPRISRSAVDFFLRWLDDRLALPEPADPVAREELAAEVAMAREFWLRLRARANAT